MLIKIEGGNDITEAQARELNIYFCRAMILTFLTGLMVGVVLTLIFF